MVSGPGAPPYRVGYVVEAGGEVLAVFLDSGPDSHAGHLIAYARQGEHTEACIEYICEQPLAREDQYRGLHSYLSARYAQTPGTPAVCLVVDQDGVPR